MSTVVGKRWVVFQGNEVQKNVTCCEAAKWKIEQLLQLAEHMRRVNDILNPKSNGYITIQVVGTDRGEFKLNYCPTCGDKYEEKK